MFTSQLWTRKLDQEDVKPALKLDNWQIFHPGGLRGGFYLFAMFPRLQKEAACLELPFSVPWMHFTDGWHHESDVMVEEEPSFEQANIPNRNQRTHKISVIFVCV